MKVKTIRCKARSNGIRCPNRFESRFNGHAWCGASCQELVVKSALEKVRANNAKKERKELKARKEKLKGKSDYKKEAQAVFNKFIRLRDSQQPCISCGSNPNDSDLITGSRWDAGHYRSRGANPELAFNEDNCHKQCVKCNRQLSGNVVNYRIRLIERIGVERVDIIEGSHKPLKYGIEDYKRIKAEYSAKIKEISK